MSRSLSYACIKSIIPVIFGKYQLALYHETREDDVIPYRDFFLSMPKRGNKGMRVVIKTGEAIGQGSS